MLGHFDKEELVILLDKLILIRCIHDNDREY